MSQRYLRLIVLIIFSLCESVIKSYAGPSGIVASFVHANTSQEASEVANNTLRVKNLTNSTVRFHVNFSMPAGWQFLGNASKDIELAPGDSVFVPARVIIENAAKGGTSYIVTAWLSSEKGIQFSSQNWYVSIPSKSEWKALIPTKQHYFITGNDSSGFSMIFRNTGNTDEQIRVSLIPDHHLEILRSTDGGPALLTFTINLPVGKDTTIAFPVIRHDNKGNSGRKDADIHSLPSRESFAIQVLAKSLVSSASWSGTTQFIKLGNTAHLNDFGHSAVPLTVEANVYDVLSNGTSMSLDAYGSMNLKHDGILNYRFQTVFITNFLEQNSFLGNNHYIGYFNNKMSVEIGEVNGWGRSLLTGKGIKASYNIGNNTIGVLYSRGPGFFKPHTNEGYGFYHNYRLKKLNWSNYVSFQNNSQLHISSSLYNTSIGFRINPKNQIIVGGGMSSENYSSATSSLLIKGFGMDATYTGTYKKINTSVSVNTGSSNYALARGVFMTSGRVSYKINGVQEVAAAYQSFNQRPEYFINGNNVVGNYVHSERYEIRYGNQSAGGIYALKPIYQIDENQSIRSTATGLGAEYNIRNLTGVRISTTGYAGYATVQNVDVPSFFTARLGVFARWEKMSLSFRYFYGPNQLAEQLRFVKDKLNPQSFHIVGSYDYWMAGGKLLLSTTGNMMYESYFQKFNFRLRPELFYYSKAGVRFSAYASFLSSSQGANPMLENRNGGQNEFETLKNTELSFGFGVRKQIGIPVPGKKYITTRVVVFKDLNGNRKLDANEEGVQDMLVNIRAVKLNDESSVDTINMSRTRGEDFISNKKGEIVYENIPAGNYKISCTSLVSQGEWFDANSGEYLLDKKQTIYIPLTKGVRLTGSLLVERDKYSEQGGEVDLSRIRVTAVDSSGKTFSVLTDRTGNFVMYLPTGIYTVAINDAALGTSFTFLQNRVTIDLSTFTENFSMTFNAVEKKRKMDIKKFNVQGEEQK